MLIVLWLYRAELPSVMIMAAYKIVSAPCECSVLDRALCHTGHASTNVLNIHDARNTVQFTRVQRYQATRSRKLSYQLSLLNRFSGTPSVTPKAEYQRRLPTSTSAIQMHILIVMSPKIALALNRSGVTSPKQNRRPLFRTLIF